MKVTIIGASGFIGSAILKEAAERDLTLTAIARHTEKIQDIEGIEKKKADIYNTDNLLEILKDQDVVISAFSGHAEKNTREYYEKGIKSLINAVKQIDDIRLMVVGGAGSLEAAPGVQLLDTPEFPEEIKPTAEGARSALHFLQKEKDLNWTMLCPSITIFPGEKTGEYRLTENKLIVDEKGESRISTGDYAKAMLDELENPRHVNKRFTVGY